MTLPTTYHPVYQAATPDVVRQEIRNAVYEGRAPRTAPTRAEQQTTQAQTPMIAPLAQPRILATGAGRASLFGPAQVGIIPGSGLSPADLPAGNTYAQPTPVTPSSPLNVVPNGTPLQQVAVVGRKYAPWIAGAIGLGAGILVARFIWG